MSKKILLLFSALSFLLGSCAYHLGVVDGSVALTDGNFTVVENTFGFARSTYILGIGGFEHRALTHAARQDMQRRFPLRKGEAYANITTDYKRSFFPLWGTNLCYVSAEKVRFEAPEAGGLAYRRENSERISFKLHDRVRLVDLKKGSSRTGNILHLRENSYVLIFDDLSTKSVSRDPAQGYAVVYRDQPDYYTGPLRLDKALTSRHTKETLTAIGFGEEYLLVTNEEGGLELIAYDEVELPAKPLSE